MFVVWFLTGMWHGASWNYIFWGLYYFCFLLLEKFYIKDRMPENCKHIYTLLVIFFGWISIPKRPVIATSKRNLSGTTRPV